MTSVRILGIDPGSVRTGVGIVDAGPTGTTSHVFHAAIEVGGEAAAGARLNRGVALERSRGCEAALPDYLAASELPAVRTVARSNAAACLRALGREEDARHLALP